MLAAYDKRAEIIVLLIIGDSVRFIVILHLLPDFSCNQYFLLLQCRHNHLSKGGNR